MEQNGSVRRISNSTVKLRRNAEMWSVPMNMNDNEGAIVLLSLRCVICLAAVSYTHLRAHETVLDLVCRLLLEKQKKKKDKRNTHRLLNK